MGAQGQALSSCLRSAETKLSKSSRTPTSAFSCATDCLCGSAQLGLAANTAGQMAGYAAPPWTPAESMLPCAKSRGWWKNATTSFAIGRQALGYACTGSPVRTEQYVPQWDRVNPSTGENEEAILDIASSDPLTGAALFFDVVVYTAYSTNAATLRSRAHKDGKAAADAAWGFPAASGHGVRGQTRRGHDYLRSPLWRRLGCRP